MIDSVKGILQVYKDTIGKADIVIKSISYHFCEAKTKLVGKQYFIFPERVSLLDIIAYIYLSNIYIYIYMYIYIYIYIYIYVYIYIYDVMMYGSVIKGKKEKSVISG